MVALQHHSCALSWYDSWFSGACSHSLSPGLSVSVPEAVLTNYTRLSFGSLDIKPILLVNIV